MSDRFASQKKIVCTDEVRRSAHRHTVSPHGGSLKGPTYGFAIYIVGVKKKMGPVVGIEPQIHRYAAGTYCDYAMAPILTI